MTKADAARREPVPPEQMRSWPYKVSLYQAAQYLEISEFMARRYATRLGGRHHGRRWFFDGWRLADLRERGWECGEEQREPERRLVSVK